MVLDREVRAALAASSMSAISASGLERLLAGAGVRNVEAGAPIRVEGDPPFVELLVRGLLRGYVSDPSGRTMTIRYCRPGALMGVATLFNRIRPRAHGNLAALVDSRLLQLEPETVRRVAERDIEVTRALLAETSTRVGEYITELEANSFATIRQRMARHLLDIAAEQQAGRRLVARASQEEIATAVGTVREMAVRVLRDMRSEGLVRTERGGIELLDPTRLDAETYGRHSV
jgi:CRP/FNR family transcriptional regulator